MNHFRILFATSAFVATLSLPLSASAKKALAGDELEGYKQAIVEMLDNEGSEVDCTKGSSSLARAGARLRVAFGSSQTSQFDFTAFVVASQKGELADDHVTVKFVGRAAGSSRGEQTLTVTTNRQHDRVVAVTLGKKACEISQGTVNTVDGANGADGANALDEDGNPQEGFSPALEEDWSNSPDSPIEPTALGQRWVYGSGGYSGVYSQQNNAQNFGPSEWGEEEETESQDQSVQRGR